MVHFDPSEYRCRCRRPECDAPMELDPVLAQRLDKLRDAYGAPLALTSGLRCAYWNRESGGVKDSEHLTGRAVDVRVTASGDRYTVMKLALTLFDRVGIHRQFLHLGVGTPKEVVWLYTA